jgi:hypothetical protein
MQILQLNTLSEHHFLRQLAPINAKLAGFEELGIAEQHHPWVDTAFNMTAFSAVAEKMGYPTIVSETIKGGEIHKRLLDMGKDSIISGAMFSKEYLLQYALE